MKCFVHGTMKVIFLILAIMCLYGIWIGKIGGWDIVLICVAFVLGSFGVWMIGLLGGCNASGRWINGGLGRYDNGSYHSSNYYGGGGGGCSGGDGGGGGDC